MEKPLHSTILATVGGIFAAVSLTIPAVWWLGPPGGAAFLIGLAFTFGALLGGRERRTVRFLLGLFLALASVSAVGSIVYHVHALDAAGFAFLLIASPWAVFVLVPFARRGKREAEEPVVAVEKAAPEDSAGAALFILAAACDALALRELSAAATDEAIRSPWEVVSPIFFLWFFLASFALLALAWRRRVPGLTVAALCLHLFVALAPAAIVYRIGYGFDGFVHVAAERIVAAEGLVTPKTPYYIGQYALVVTLAKVFRLPLEAVDRFLLPGMTALFLPAMAAWLARRGFAATRTLAAVAATSVLLLPLGVFVATTPQGLADLYLLGAAFFGTAWLLAHRPPLGVALVPVAAALATHPLAGLPAAGFIVFASFLKIAPWRGALGTTIKAILCAAAFAALAAATPALFAWRGAADASGVFSRPLPELLSRIPFEGPGLETRYRPALDLAEAFDRNHDLLLVLMAAAGAWILARRPQTRNPALAATAAVAALLVSVVALKGSSFRDVIGYEQDNYGNRLYEAAVLLLAPLALAAWGGLWRALERTDAGVRLTLALLFAGAATASAFAAFPRLDDFRFSRGYSTSKHDVEAVRYVDAHGARPHLVLANQSTSAAALREFGFKTYFGDQFYYPIPTGAPLYRSYLEMVYGGARRETMEAAMRSASVSEGWLVVDRYWRDSARIVEQAKKTADGWSAIGDGEAYVFSYRLTRP